MNAEIIRLQGELGLSHGQLLAIAREAIHDSMVKSLECLRREEEAILIGVLLEIAASRRVMGKWDAEEALLCALSCA
jgi:hypothetical protein